MPIENGDIILLYTDGVTEAAGKAGVMFGERNLERARHKYAHLPPSEIVKGIILDVQAHMAEQRNDITLLALKRLDPSSRIAA